jgi:hypothetical protein
MSGEVAVPPVAGIVTGLKRHHFDAIFVQLDLNEE